MQFRVLFLATSLFLYAVALPLATKHKALAIRQTDEDDDAEDEDDGGSECAGLGGIVGCVVDGVGDFSPIEDGQFEGDVDAGGESEAGGDASAIANGLLGGGSASSAHNNQSTVATSSQCNLLGCTSGAAAGNGDNTSTSTSSSGLGSSPLVTTNGPLVSVGHKLMRRVYAMVLASKH